MMTVVVRTRCFSVHVFLKILQKFRYFGTFNLSQQHNLLQNVHIECSINVSIWGLYGARCSSQWVSQYIDALWPVYFLGWKRWEVGREAELVCRHGCDAFIHRCRKEEGQDGSWEGKKDHKAEWTQPGDVRTLGSCPERQTVHTQRHTHTQTHF